jgi:hypothetical protein
METFPTATSAIVSSGAEIGLHGYSHEGAYAMTPAQERAVLTKCIDLCTKLKKRPVGYRAPLYRKGPLFLLFPLPLHVATFFSTKHLRTSSTLNPGF